MTRLELFAIIDSKCYSSSRCRDMKNLVNGCPCLSSEDMEVIAYDLGHLYSSDKMLEAVKSVVDGAERRANMVSIDDLQKLAAQQKQKTVEQLRAEQARKDGEAIGRGVASLFDALLNLK